MPTSDQPLMHKVYSNPFTVALVYSILIWWMVCPPQFNITTDLIGYLGSDTIDTLSLRWAFWNSDAHFFPVGWNAIQVTPNFIDHLLFLPLLNLPFPLADNLWWILNLWLSMLAAHTFGRSLQPTSHAAGWLAGMSLLCGDTIFRDMNWGHAPQIMWWAPLLCLTYLSKWHSDRKQKWLLWSGCWLGIAGSCYFYFMPFILLVTIPLWMAYKRTGLQWIGIGIVVLSPNLWMLYTFSSEMVPTPKPPLISGQSLTDIHSATLNTLWTGVPIDISNIWSIIWICAVIWGGYTIRRTHPIQFRVGLWTMAVAFILILGSNGALFTTLQELPLFSRLLWPERFGMLFVIGGMYWIVHQPKGIWILPLMMMETQIRSKNLPLHTESMNPWNCLRSLQQDSGAILELPLKDGDGLYNQQSLRQRVHKRPLVNPFILPPFVSPPHEWAAIQRRPDITAIDGHAALAQHHIDSLQALGVETIIMDTVRLPLNKQALIQEHLISTLDEPIDLGCAKVWSLNRSTISSNPKSTSPLFTAPSSLFTHGEPEFGSPLKSTQQPWYVTP